VSSSTATLTWDRLPEEAAGFGSWAWLTQTNIAKTNPTDSLAGSAVESAPILDCSAPRRVFASHERALARDTIGITAVRISTNR
jgi:hypothetical protein